MKISTFFEILLVVGVIFGVYGLMINEENNNYPSDTINSSEWQDRYDYTQSLNESIAPLQSTFATIEDTNTGWFVKVVAGIAAIPYAVIRIPVLLFTGFGLGGSMATGLLTSLGIPLFIIMAVIIGLVFWGIFKLIELYQRWYI